MYKILLLLCTLYSFSNTAASTRNNAKPAEKNEFPFVVSIGRAIENNHICGGALISQKHVLTSEHCVHDKRAKDLQVLIGTDDFHSGRKYKVVSIMRFDDWTKRRHSASYPNNDVAILTLETDVTDVEPGLIDDRSRNTDFYGKNVVTAGWGADDDENVSRHLQKTFLKVLTPDQCNEKLYRLTRKRYEINEKYFCTATTPYTAMSKSDEGSPVLHDNLIIGVNCETFPDFTGDYPVEQNLHVGIEHYQRFIRDVLNSD